MRKAFRLFLAFALLASTLSLAPMPAGATAGALNYGLLNIGCAPGVQNGVVLPQTESTYAGCTITVNVHNTTQLAQTFAAATGTALTNPVVLTLGSGTVTTSGTTVTYVSGTNFVTTGSWVNQTIVINGVSYSISSVGSSTSITTVQTLPTLASAVSYSVAPQSDQIFLADGSYDVCVTNTTSTPPMQGTCTVGLTVSTFNYTANKATLTAAFTDASSTALQVIPGLSFSIPASFVGNVTFHCALGYSEATPAAGAGFGIAMLTTAPTRLDATTVVYSSAAGASANAPITNLTTTTPTAGATVTPGSTVVYPAYIDGVVQAAGGGAQTLQFYVEQGTGADVIVVAAGSYCYAF